MGDAPASSSLVAPAYRQVVTALAASEERYRTLVEGVRRYAIFMPDPKGIVLTWNNGVGELLGYGREEFIGHSGALCFTPEDRAAGLFERELAEARRAGETSVNRTARHKDGSHFGVNECATALHDAGGAPVGFAKVMREAVIVGGPAGADADVALATGELELTKTLALLHREIEQRRRLEAALLTAVEDERQRLGRDLHDDLVQQLTGVTLMAWVFAKDLQRKGAAEDAERVEQLSALITDAAHSARSLAHGLHLVTLSTPG